MKVWNAEANNLFLQALELQEGPARRAFLDQACGRDAELRRRVEGLLAAGEQAGSFLESPAYDSGEFPAATVAESDQVDAAGTAIGPYKLLEKLGEGGFGSVYVAEQCEPVQRRVALKVIKRGMDCRQVIARFEAERQALAMMDHPNIARVLDAGATDAQSALGPGRPYFAMELVRGTPITTFCDEDNLSIRRRLGLFIDVCHAVQHAHQKGVIHRDIKPTNVLVTMHDDKPVPKVIDFGLAKATHGRLTEKTVYTGFRQLMGTPAYMSPEQAQMSGIDVDTRSDVYSLGVLLYELLTGTTPFDNRTLLGAGFDEMCKTIREVEPPTPSISVTAMAQARRRNGAARPPDDAAARKDSAEIARRRATDPRALCTELRGDLDWIVMKCLEKDRARRYEAANALAADVQHFLNGEPVVAAPPSATYRVMKFARRHKVGVLAGTLVAAALVLGMIGTGIGLVRAEAALGREQEQRGLVEKREKELEGLYVRARESERIAEQRATTSDRVKEFMLEVFASQDPDSLQGDELPASELLRRGTKRLEVELRDEPLIQAELLHSIGNVHERRGEFADAVAALKRALELRIRELGEIDVLVALTRTSLGWALKENSRGCCAQAQYEIALPVLEASYGPDHEKVAYALNGLAEVLRKGDPQRAEELHRRALEIRIARLGEDDPDTAQSLVNLGIVLRSRGDNAGAVDCYQKALPILRANGEDSSGVGVCYSNLGVALTAQGHLTEALDAYLAAQRIQERLYKGGHVSLAMTKISLGRTQELLGRFADAGRNFEDALKMQRQCVDNVHMEVARGLSVLASHIRFNQEDPASALPLKREELDICRELLDSEDMRLAQVCCELASLLSELGQHEEAIALAREYFCICEAAPRGPPPSRPYWLGRVLLDAGQPEQAEPLLRLACDDGRPKLDPQATDFVTQLGRCLAAQSRSNEAEWWLLSANARAIEDANAARADPGVLKEIVAERWGQRARQALAAFYDATGRQDDAEAWRILVSEGRARIQALQNGSASE